ncbi:unnamed protein product [Didymodactylos carnosus]|uniref:Uncharacterized protein n=1 Tax=Didymodactylos carnosus TaxID=1234261 RepID=A0A815XRU8_9BILA|nr:unnamed protein product [Didymodactylos carnosus]CAF1560758.1 unnamed protein product [Didymodactylos carnosus]CAF3748112.1 unnamed protein product [Didymodactylos carnosus]CAF4422216.1 unnamed protein product [Didymodactylos carnosus]
MLVSPSTITNNGVQIVLLLVVVTTTITIVTAKVKRPACFAEVDGIYLAKFSPTKNNTGYGLIYFSQLGDVLVIGSDEKTNKSALVSDGSGRGKCKDSGPNKGRKSVSFNFATFGESGNRSVILSDATVKCRGAVSQSSDNVIYCSNGIRHDQSFKFQSVNYTTGRYTDPISSKTRSKFEMRRLYSHSTVSADPNGRDRCYDDMSGTYIALFNGVYRIMAFTPLGTAIGTYECTNTHTLGGQENYFTYPANRDTKGSSIVTNTFYLQCPRKTSVGQYENCTGIQYGNYYPLQYQRMPFRDGIPLKKSSSTFIASRLFTSPEIKQCHTTYAGVYANSFKASIDPRAPFQATFTLYSNGVLFAKNADEDTSPNSAGVWSCTDNGRIMYKRVVFSYPALNPTNYTFNYLRVYTAYVELHCNGTAANAFCQGTSNSTFYPAALPKNGQFQTTPANSYEVLYIAKRLNIQQ